MSMYDGFGDDFCPEYFEEPGEADLVIQKAKDDLYGLLKQEVRETLQNVSEAKNTLKNVQSQVREAKADLERMKFKFKQERERFEKAKDTDIPKEYLSRMVRAVVGDYAPGDTVWTIKRTGSTKTCPMCHGEKRLIAWITEANVTITCPKCNGTGCIYVYDKPEAVERKISEIHLKLCFSKDRANYWNKECIYLDHDDYTTDLKRIYPTKEAAEAAIAKEKANEKAD